ncbi:hypothetical protein HAR83_000490 [Vibrio metschnikovii]|uniref:hypothetical protein n=1 Tax=Vibrio metschnikovii TaxID=28172 RepID=UPI0029FEC050|nr:hypothetical protein [Vibrio metschnikovii]
MQLEIRILSGNRSGQALHIGELSSNAPISSWVKENEALEIRLETSVLYHDAELLLYDHELEATEIIEEEERTIFTWKPKRRRGEGYECLFFNYFGIAEFTVKLFASTNSNPEYINFQPIEVLASKSNSQNVERMLAYLANLDDDELHSIFQTTKYNAGFKDGLRSPESNLERLEYTFQLIYSVLPEILKRPITKLLPVQKNIIPNDYNVFDDSTLGWLMSNLSELDECDDIHQSHLKYGSKMYRASSLQVSELEENPDVYENWVIHGFLNFLIVEITKQLKSYESVAPTKSTIFGVKPEGYSSFFDQVHKFRRQLLGNQISRCEKLLNSATRLKFHLERHLPVNKALTQRPILTPKAASNIAYRSIFIEFINWFEKSSPDWSVYENLFAIKSIPILFESYSYYRVAETLSKFFKSNQKIGTYWEDQFGNEITLFREPVYWMNRNNNVSDANFINTEGLVVKDDNVLERSHTHKYSHRCPDIVIEIKKPDNQRILQVLDAKYTSDRLAVKRYLPECTMKYVHGIHLKGSGKTVVSSMTILFPSEQGNLHCFHSDEHNVLSNNPITPSLQCVGLELDKSEHNDNLQVVIKAILKNILVNDYVSQAQEFNVVTF